MYIGSFIKQLFKPKNIPTTIFFLLNCFIVFLIFSILPIELFESNNNIYLGLIGLAIDFVFVLFSLSPAGEAIWRFNNKIKKAPDQAIAGWDLACSIFDEVKKQAIEEGNKISKNVKLYYSEDRSVNAFALGHQTVIVTAGSLAVNNADFFRGIFAHELGHITHGDGDLKLGINVSNVIISIFVMIVSILSNIIAIAMQTNKNALVRLLGIVLAVLGNYIILGIFNLWNLLGTLMINWTSRKNEFAADKFAKDIGYGYELTAALRAIDRNPQKHSKLSIMYQTHPDTQDRLEMLAA